ncbi:hypothetical protein GCM10010123_35880 [Pilimelia anulata]|uniref:HTH cro/C1-type domain-containing protein n=1 Tax=Pilimelia anulata TaxID=53371 RepID=A0A8J3B8U6_9ACTN|nr:Scr1 family TA system antitoxin-like transcriptional regulator [Pilimelia anulata]GGK02733.1 hypothetical protein GCM10010123_35880 [Pilimelia anulata]
MTTSPSSAAREERRALGVRLRQLRIDARLTATALAETYGWQLSKVSKIEHGKQLPSKDDIRDWCAACSCLEQFPDLLATLENVNSAYIEWHLQTRAGQKRPGGSKDKYERTTLFRIFEPLVMPGILQTESYYRSIHASWRSFLSTPDDVEEALAYRAERTERALTAGKRVLVVLGEEVCRTRVTGPSEHESQLAHLLVMAKHPAISLGIIPSITVRMLVANVGFWIFGMSEVSVETPTRGRSDDSAEGDPAVRAAIQCAASPSGLRQGRSSPGHEGHGRAVASGRLRANVSQNTEVDREFADMVAALRPVLH